MALFPQTPTNGDPHTEGEITWIFNDGVWVKQSPIVRTDNVQLSDPSNPAAVLTAYPQTLPEVPDTTTTQFDVNRWFVDALTHLDNQFEDGDIIAGISVGENPPDEAVNGTLWFDSSEDSLSLFLYYNPNEDGSGIWVPAAPPISAIEEINELLGSLGEDVDLLEERVLNISQIGITEPSPVQDGYIWHNTSNGVNRSYVYDGIDSKWRLMSPDSRISDSPPDVAEEGDLWFESDTDLALFIYYNGDWIPAAPPSSVEGRVAAGEAVQAEIIGKIGEVTADLTQLENKVNALEGGVFDDSWTFEVDLQTPRQGEFTLMAAGVVTTDFAAATSLILSTESASGRDYTFDNVTVNDVIRINSLDGEVDSSVEYKVNQVITPGAFGVTYQLGSGTGVDGTTYGFTFLPQFDPSGLATITYVDDQDDLKVSKSGDVVKGVLTVSSEGNPNDDGVRLYMKDNTGATNFTIFPSGVVTGKNVIRVNKDSGDCFQIRDASGGAVRYKVTAEGNIEGPKLKLTGGSSADINMRVIDVQSGQAGRLSYNALTKLSWGASNVWIGSATTTGEAQQAVTLNLQNNKIDNVSELNLTHQGAVGKKFAITGELASGTNSNEFFYSYRTADGETDAMNYNGKIENNANLVNKKYVDDAVSGVSTDALMPKTGGTFTGMVSFNNSGNQQVDFIKSGNNDIRYQGTWIISLQGNDNPLIKVNTHLDMNSKQIQNLRAPSASHHAVTKGSLQGIKVVQTSNGSTGTESGGFYYSDGRLFYKV